MFYSSIRNKAVSIIGKGKRGGNVLDEIRETLEGCSGIPDMKGNAPHAVAAHGVQEDAVSVVNEKSYVTVTRDGIVMGVQ